MNTPTAVSPNLQARLDRTTDADPTAQEAIGRLYDATGEIERLIPAELWARFDRAWCDTYDAIHLSAWRCGYEDGRTFAQRWYTFVKSVGVSRD
jgi:hypothetical protein